MLASPHKEVVAFVLTTLYGGALEAACFEWSRIGAMRQSSCVQRKRSPIAYWGGSRHRTIEPGWGGSSSSARGTSSVGRAARPGLSVNPVRRCFAVEPVDQLGALGRTPAGTRGSRRANAR